MKILICGDSYCCTDDDYPDLHWSTKLKKYQPDADIMNLSVGGHSNALITLQFMNGLNFDPDFVIFSFTESARFEFDATADALDHVSPVLMHNYLMSRYNTNLRGTLTREQNQTVKYWTVHASQDLEQLKNYFQIVCCLTLARERGLRFCFSLGGFEYQQDYVSLLSRNFVPDVLTGFQDHMLSTNLWDHTGTNVRPWFHVEDDHVHQLFAEQCLAHANR